MAFKASIVIALSDNSIEALYVGGDAATAEKVWKDARGKYPEVQLLRKPLPFRRWKGDVAKPVAKKAVKAKD